MVEQVKDDTSIKLAFPGFDLDDVCDPFGFRLQCGEVSF